MVKSESEDKLHSLESAGEFLGGISKNTLKCWLSRGYLQRSKVRGRTMIRQSELEKLIVDGGKSPAPSRERSNAR